MKFSEQFMQSHELDRFNFSASGVTVHKILALEIEIYRLPGKKTIGDPKMGHPKFRSPKKMYFRRRELLWCQKQEKKAKNRRAK